MQIDIIDSFQQIRQLSQQLTQAINSTPPHWPVWLAPDVPADAARQHISHHLGQYWHQHSGDGRKAERLAGALAVSHNSLTLARQLNQHKQQFQRQLATLRREGNPNATLSSLLQARHGRHEAIQQALQQAGMQRLNLTQVYRQLPLLEHSPRLLGFSWAQGKRSKKRLSRDQALALLHERFGPTSGAIARQLASLPGDAPLALIRPVQPSLIINCAIGQGSDTRRCQRQGHSPLLYLWPGHNPPAPPRINWPGPLAEQSRNQPRREKGSETLLIPALHLYQLA